MANLMSEYNYQYYGNGSKSASSPLADFIETVLMTGLLVVVPIFFLIIAYGFIQELNKPKAQDENNGDVKISTLRSRHPDKNSKY